MIFEFFLKKEQIFFIEEEKIFQPYFTFKKNPQNNDTTGEFFIVKIFNNELSKKENTCFNSLDDNLKQFFLSFFEYPKKAKILFTDCDVYYKGNWHKDEKSTKNIRILIPLKNFTNSGIEFENFPPISYKEHCFYLIKQDIWHRTWCKNGEKNRSLLVIDYENKKREPIEKIYENLCSKQFVISQIIG